MSINLGHTCFKKSRKTNQFGGHIYTLFDVTLFHFSLIRFYTVSFDSRVMFNSQIDMLFGIFFIGLRYFASEKTTFSPEN